jgi:hypothetical protein
MGTVDGQFRNGSMAQLFQMEAFCKINQDHMVEGNRVSHFPVIRLCG